MQYILENNENAFTKNQKGFLVKKYNYQTNKQKAQIDKCLQRQQKISIDYNKKFILPIQKILENYKQKCITVQFECSHDIWMFPTLATLLNFNDKKKVISELKKMSEFLKERKLIHYNLKPTNIIMLNHQKELFLTGLGDDRNCMMENIQIQNESVKRRNIIESDHEKQQLLEKEKNWIPYLNDRFIEIQLKYNQNEQQKQIKNLTIYDFLEQEQYAIGMMMLQLFQTFDFEFQQSEDLKKQLVKRQTKINEAIQKISGSSKKEVEDIQKEILNQFYPQEEDQFSSLSIQSEIKDTVQLNQIQYVQQEQGISQIVDERQSFANQSVSEDEGQSFAYQSGPGEQNVENDPPHLQPQINFREQLQKIQQFPFLSFYYFLQLQLLQFYNKDKWFYQKVDICKMNSLESIDSEQDQIVAQYYQYLINSQNGNISIGSFQNTLFTGEIILNQDDLVVHYKNIRMENEIISSGERGQKSVYQGGKNKKFFKISEYEGEIKKGQEHGVGKLIHFDKNPIQIYKGEFIEGKKQGSGTLKVPCAFLRKGDFQKYQGDFKNNKFSGVGTIMYFALQGEIQQTGSFKYGKQIGSHILIFKDQDGKVLEKRVKYFFHICNMIFRVQFRLND